MTCTSPRQPQAAARMSSLSSVEAKLPPGFRFHPRDDELVCDYLIKWINGNPTQHPFLIQVDLNKCEPWDIPETACVGNNEWYFYSQRDRKYATGLRKNRATISGYWKATGKDRSVIRNGTLVGMRKTLVFYEGRAPKGKKTYWVMHEFRLEAGIVVPGPKIDSSVKEDWVLCRVFYKNRSDLHQDKLESGVTYEDTSSPSLPALLDPHNTFPQLNHEPNTNDFFQDQVPCFSIFSSNQTCPNFSLFTPQITPNNKIIPNLSNILPNNSQAVINDPPSDQKVIKAVLKNLTKMENPNDSLSSTMKGGSGNFIDGSSDSYFSELGMSFMWNNYP